MNDYIILLPEILASVVTSLVAVTVAFYKFKANAKFEFSQAELSDRLDFRRTLMERVQQLEKRLEEAQTELMLCHEQHSETEHRLVSLESEISRGVL